ARHAAPNQGGRARGERGPRVRDRPRGPQRRPGRRRHRVLRGPAEAPLIVMAYKRADRVNALLQRELGTLISEELRDPRLAFATVTAVGQPRRIAIVSHRDPDPDTIGSALALGLGLESLGKRVSWHCADPVPEASRFLSGTERFTQEPPPEDVDLVVTVDFGSPDRAKFALPTRPPLANI